MLCRGEDDRPRAAGATEASGNAVRLRARLRARLRDRVRARVGAHVRAHVRAGAPPLT